MKRPIEAAVKKYQAERWVELVDEIACLRRALRRINDNCRAVVGDTDTENDRACGMCSALRTIRDLSAGAPSEARVRLLEQTNPKDAELAHLRRENKRLRGWLRYLLQQHGDSGTMRDGFVVGDCLNALAGKPAPPECPRRQARAEGVTMSRIYAVWYRKPNGRTWRLQDAAWDKRAMNDMARDLREDGLLAKVTIERIEPPKVKP